MISQKFISKGKILSQLQRRVKTTESAYPYFYLKAFFIFFLLVPVTKKRNRMGLFGGKQLNYIVLNT